MKNKGHKIHCRRCRKRRNLTVRVAQGALLTVKVVLGAVAWKVTEVAIHTGEASTWAGASALSATLLIPAMGIAWLDKLLDE